MSRFPFLADPQRIGASLSEWMTSRSWVVVLLFCSAGALQAQARPTAARTFQLSAFGLLTGNYTGLNGGRNVSVTLGGDLGFYNLHRYLLSAEVRGTYPIKGGQVDAQESALAGLRIDRRFAPLTVFGEALGGRGGIEYQNGGYILPPFVYYSTNTAVYGAGGGAELDVRRGFALKVEGLVEHWATPVASSGTIYSKQVSGGVVYRFGADGRPVRGVRD